MRGILIFLLICLLVAGLVIFTKHPAVVSWLDSNEGKRTAISQVRSSRDNEYETPTNTKSQVYADSEVRSEAASPPPSVATVNPSEPGTAGREIPFPKDQLGAFISEKLHLVVGYPLNWLPGRVDEPKKQKEGLPADFYPSRVMQSAWFSPTHEQDRAAMIISVQRPGGLKALLPSESLMELAHTLQDHYQHEGIKPVSISLVDIRKVGDAQFCQLYGDQDAIVAEGVSDGIWQFHLFTVDRGLIYDLTLSVQQNHLHRYKELFRLVVRYFTVDGTISDQPHSRAFDGLHHLSNDSWTNSILFICGLMGVNELFVTQPDGSKLERISRNHGSWAVKSRHENCVYFYSENRIFRWRQGSAAQSEVVISNFECLSFDISPDGKKICYYTLSGQEGLYVAELSNPDVPMCLANGSALTPRWSPDGTQIAFSRGGQVCVMAADGTDLRRIRGAIGYCPEWFHSGQSLLFNSEGTIRMVDLATESIVDVVETGYLSGVAISPDDRFIAYAAIRQGSRDLYVWDRIFGEEILIFVSSLNCDVMDW